MKNIVLSDNEFKRIVLTQINRSTKTIGYTKAAGCLLNEYGKRIVSLYKAGKFNELKPLLINFTYAKSYSCNGWHYTDVFCTGLYIGNRYYILSQELDRIVRPELYKRDPVTSSHLRCMRYGGFSSADYKRPSSCGRLN